MGETEDERTAQAGVLFENFVQATTCKGTLQAFSILCRQLELDPLDYANFYRSLKVAISTWKVKALWTKLDKRAQNKVYNQNKACQGTRGLIIGGGPCGLRTAIELALLGCKVVVIEKRDTFSRNNVLHLWPFTIHDLRGLGAKKFYGKFCVGAIDHISIRYLQLMLLKVCLILGVEIHINVEFVKLVEPPTDQSESPGWRAEVRPCSHPVADFDFNVVIGADGRKNTLDGFGRKEFRGKLAIAITANFVNRNTTAEAKVEEISGVAFIFNQKFFMELKEDTGIDLENIVYYRDNTHYFVMTAKKHSLLEKGVIMNDYIETERLLSPDNVNQKALLSYAREAADFGTNYQLPSLDYAINHYGQPDVAMFDFTSMYASENAALIREKHGHQLLVTLVGDSLLEPFWPMGTGCARGFMAAFDSAWMVRGWALGRSPLEILAERESIYRLLPQTTTENISKNFEQYAIDPATRYPNLNSSCVRPHQVRHLFIDGQRDMCLLERGGPTQRSVNLSRGDSEVRPSRLLTWCQKQTQGYRGVDVTNLTSSWRNGLALCALVHRRRPELIDYDSLNEEDVAGNNQLAFDLAEREFGIQPVTSGEDMAAVAEPDKLLIVLYLSKFYEAFRNYPGNDNEKGSGEADENSEGCPAKTNDRQLNPPQPKKRTPREDNKPEDDSVSKRRRKGNHYLTELSCHSASPAGEDGELRENKVRSMATQLLAKFEENSSTAKMHSKSDEDPFDPSSFPSTTAHLLSEDEEEEERKNPRFAQPQTAPPPPPLLPPRPKWQPSVYLCLRENPSAVAQQNAFHCCSKSPCHPSCSTSPSQPKNPLCPLRTPSPNAPKCHYPQRTSLDPAIGRSSENAAQRSKHSGQSIKERALLLSSMFPGSNRPPGPHSKSQVELSTYSPRESSTTSSPSPASVSKSYIVHPVPDPTTQAGFSSVPRYTAGHMDRMQKDSSERSSYAASAGSASSKSKTCAAFSSTCFEESPNISDTNCENEHSRSSPHAVSVLHKESYDGIHESSLNNLESKREKVRNAFKKMAENKHLKCIGSCAPEKSIVRSESCPTGTASYVKESYSSSQCVVRKAFPPGLGGSDVCHFCSKRVYVMERLSADGYFFHRECFRCNVCNSTLRLGAHIFDSQEEKFYCKMHYAQRQSGTHMGGFRRKMEDQRRANNSSLDGGGFSMAEGSQLQPQAGAAFSMHMERLEDQPQAPGDTEMAVEALEAPCVVTPTTQDLVRAMGHSQDCTTDSCKTKQNHRWKRKIRGTFPLIFIKHFQRRLPQDKEGPETVLEADSDFEEVPSAEKNANSDTSSVTSPDSQMSEEHPTKTPSNSSTPKMRLIVSLSVKEKLLNWDTPVIPEEAPINKVQAEAEDKLQRDSSQIVEPSPSQTSPSALGRIANAFRRTFSVTNASRAIPMRSKWEGTRKQWPGSEGALSFSSLFSADGPGPHRDEKRVSKCKPHGGSIRANPWGSEQDLPSLLQQVSLKGRRNFGGMFSDDMASLPGRRINLFSSLRLRKREGSAGEGPDHEAQKQIRTILSNLRKKAYRQQNHEEPTSSDDEDKYSTSSQKILPCPDTRRRKQERMVALQAKAEQLKRLHRAQAIQRQLEEVAEKLKDLEKKGVTIEKIIRGEMESYRTEESDEAELYQSWFRLVLEKNSLARYESELMIFAQELELEDTQSRLQRELRQSMATEDTKKSAYELQQEQVMLAEIMRTVERRDALVSVLEEQRLKESTEDKDLEGLVLSKGYEFNWAPADNSWVGGGAA
ncbi:F-actin-monooxygenase mical2b-like isoform 3-T3 [Spinachia spinachia]